VQNFKEYVDKAKKLSQRIAVINNFDDYEEEELSQAEVRELVDSLKTQHLYLFESEQNNRVYKKLKERAEEFVKTELGETVSVVCDLE